MTPEHEEAERDLVSACRKVTITQLLDMAAENPDAFIGVRPGFHESGFYSIGALCGDESPDKRYTCTRSTGHDEYHQEIGFPCWWGKLGKQYEF